MRLRIALYLPFLTGLVLGPAAGPAPPAQTASYPVPHSRAVQGHPIEPLHNQNGYALRNPKNSIVTSNWAGYAVANYETSLS